MKITDAIERLNGYLADDLFDPPQEDLDAMELAVRILTTLEANRAKAEAIITSYKNCVAGHLEDCEGCPYHMQGCTFKMEQDAERLLELAYLQGGTTNDET